MKETYVESMRSRIETECIHLPGVRAIILNGRNELLLQRRTEMNFWCLPSGAVELHETALEALKREVMEETGLEVCRAEPMALYSGPGQRFQYPNGDEIQNFSVAFVVRDWVGLCRPDGVEGSEVRFWPLDALPDNLVPIHVQTVADFKRYNGCFVLG